MKLIRIILASAGALALTETTLLQAWGPHIHISIPSPPIHIPPPANIVQQVRNDAAHMSNEAGKVASQGATVVQKTVVVTAPIAAVRVVATNVPITTKVVEAERNQVVKSADQLKNAVTGKGDQAVEDSAKGAKDAANATAHDAKVIAEGANDLKRDVVQGLNEAGSGAATGARAVGSAADAVGKSAAHLTLDAAHVVLLFAQIERKATTDELRSALTSASNSVQEIGEGHLLTAAQDLSVTVTSSMAALTHTNLNDEQEKDDFKDAADMEHALLEAYEQIHEGHYGTAVEAMGRSFNSAGELVAQVDPDSGAVLLQAGAAVEQQAPYAERTFQDLKHAELELAVRDQADEYIDPLKSAIADAKAAAADAKNGKYGEATMEATTAVILSAGDSKDAADAQKAILSAEAALDSAKAAVVQGKDGNYGTSAEDAGDALALAGQAIKPYDQDSGNELFDLGTQVHESAAHGKEATETGKQIADAMKDPIAGTKPQ
jgi:hypothetical protein